LKKLTSLGTYLLFLTVLALGSYELTAKSPTWLGQPLPGWQASLLAENSTRWQQPTGILPVDKLLHEGEEAARFYGFLYH
jgi:hypothetical protein